MESGNDDIFFYHHLVACQVPILLPLGVSLCCFDFAGCGLSEGEYVSLGYFETEDLRTVVEHIRRLPSVGVVALWGR